jgi:hypothetical protein
MCFDVIDDEDDIEAILSKSKEE